MILIMYVFMLIFDLAVLAGAVYLIDQRSWSVGTIFVALIIMAGSYPGTLIKIFKGTDSL